MDDTYREKPLERCVRMRRDQPDRCLTVEEAGEVFMLWHEKAAREMGDYVAAALLGYDPPARRGRPAQRS